METATTKPLGKSDAATISELDKLSGFHVLEWVEDFSGWNDESWGLYLGGKLIGYCTIGYADNECPVITDHELWTPDSYQLSRCVYPISIPASGLWFQNGQGSDQRPLCIRRETAGIFTGVKCKTTGILSDDRFLRNPQCHGVSHHGFSAR